MVDIQGGIYKCWGDDCYSDCDKSIKLSERYEMI